MHTYGWQGGADHVLEEGECIGQRTGQENTRDKNTLGWTRKMSGGSHHFTPRNQGRAGWMWGGGYVTRVTDVNVTDFHATAHAPLMQTPQPRASRPSPQLPQVASTIKDESDNDPRPPCLHSHALLPPPTTRENRGGFGKEQSHGIRDTYAGLGSRRGG